MLGSQKIAEATKWMQNRTVILKGKLVDAQRVLQRYVEQEKLLNIGSGKNSSVDVLISDE